MENLLIAGKKTKLTFSHKQYSVQGYMQITHHADCSVETYLPAPCLVSRQM